MTIGYYAIPPPTPGSRVPKTEPWPHCRACAARPGVQKVTPIDETAHPSTTCRGCKVKLRQWR